MMVKNLVRVLQQASKHRYLTDQSHYCMTHARKCCNVTEMKKVWILKAVDDGNKKYEEALSSSGFIPICISPLSFTFVNHEVLKEALENPDHHSGIIFTSPRAAEAVAHLYLNLPVSAHQVWMEKKTFAVGHSTAQLVHNHLGLSCIGEIAGNVRQLMPFILEETEPFCQPLLFPCGNLKKDELPIFLASNDRDFRAIVCYETEQNPQLKSLIEDAIQVGKPDFISFFSPSGVNYTLQIFDQLGLCLTGTKVVAFGPSTNAALVEHGIPVDGVCETPSVDGLLHVLSSP